MSKLGKIVASSALGLTMGLSLLSPSAFAQSVTSSNANVSARTAAATTAVVPLGGRSPAGNRGHHGDCGGGGGYDGDGSDGDCGGDGYYYRPRLNCESNRVQVIVGVRQRGRVVWTRVWVTNKHCARY
ncbi:MAG TPA: hypothetical protein VFN35_09840 [Ktedonobacteraceae bacterium]|nr:hypothetical protein [Ktedonobacteraceae bacterium]